MSESAVYPINPPAAHRIADDAEALRVAVQVAAVLQEHAAERDLMLRLNGSSPRTRGTRRHWHSPYD